MALEHRFEAELLVGRHELVAGNCIAEAVIITRSTRCSGRSSPPRCTAADARPKRSARSRVPGRRSRRSSGSTSVPSCAAWRPRSSITIRRSTWCPCRRLACGRSLGPPGGSPRPASAPALVGRRAELQVLEVGARRRPGGATPRWSSKVPRASARHGSGREEFASGARQAGVLGRVGELLGGMGRAVVVAVAHDPPVGRRRRAGNGLRRARPAATAVGGGEHRRVARPTVRAARGGPPGALPQRPAMDRSWSCSTISSGPTRRRSSSWCTSRGRSARRQVLLVVMLHDLGIGRSDSVTSALAALARPRASKRVRLPRPRQSRDHGARSSKAARTPLSVELSSAINTQSRGQPVLRHRAGARRPGAGSGLDRAPGRCSSVPAGLADVVRQRLDRLTPARATCSTSPRSSGATSTAACCSAPPVEVRTPSTTSSRPSRTASSTRSVTRLAGSASRTPSCVRCS